MATVNKHGYVTRVTVGKTYPNNKSVKRSWYLPKWYGDKNMLFVEIKKIYFPKEYGGKRVRFKVEIVTEDDGT